MILGSFVALPIGMKAKAVVTDFQKNDQNISFVVLREATHEEYIQQCIEMNAVKPYGPPDDFYYKIAVD